MLADGVLLDHPGNLDRVKPSVAPLPDRFGTFTDPIVWDMRAEISVTYVHCEMCGCCMLVTSCDDGQMPSSHLYGETVGRGLSRHNLAVFFRQICGVWKSGKCLYSHNDTGPSHILSHPSHFLLVRRVEAESGRVSGIGSIGEHPARPS